MKKIITAMFALSLFACDSQQARNGGTIVHINELAGLAKLLASCGEAPNGATVWLYSNGQPDVNGQAWSMQIDAITPVATFACLTLGLESMGGK